MLLWGFNIRVELPCVTPRKYCKHARASLMAQWERVCLSMLVTPVQFLLREDPTCFGATKPLCHSCWTCALEPRSQNHWDHLPQPLKSPHPRARAPQQEKPPQWEAHTPQLEGRLSLREDLAQPKINKQRKLLLKNLLALSGVTARNLNLLQNIQKN